MSYHVNKATKKISTILHSSANAAATMLKTILPSLPLTVKMRELWGSKFCVSDRQGTSLIQKLVASAHAMLITHRLFLTPCNNK